MIIDPLYLALIAPAFLLSLWATFLTRSRFARYAAVPTALGLSGAEAARRLLDAEGLRAVRVVEHAGWLSDHYDPRHREVRLSPEVFAGRSISTVAVAAHEAGHALQQAAGYWPLRARTAIVPFASVGSNLAYLFIFAGLGLQALSLAYLGVVLFTAVVALQLVTLPVEFDASRRADAALAAHGLIAPGEREGVRKVLGAAALTYVAAATSAVLTLVYFLIRLGVLGGRHRARELGRRRTRAGTPRRRPTCQERSPRCSAN